MDPNGRCLLLEAINAVLCPQRAGQNVPLCKRGVLLLEVTNAHQRLIVNGIAAHSFQMNRSP